MMLRVNRYKGMGLIVEEEIKRVYILITCNLFFLIVCCSNGDRSSVQTTAMAEYTLST